MRVPQPLSRLLLPAVLCAREPRPGPGPGGGHRRRPTRSC